MASTIQVDKIQDTGGNTILQSDGSGTATTTLPVGFGGTGAATLAGAGLANTPMWYVRKTSDQALSDNSYTKVTWNSEVIDTDSAFASDKFTVPSDKAGKYYISTGVGFYDNDTQQYHYVLIYKNGSNVSADPSGISTTSNDTNRYWQTNNMILDLAVSDYVEVYVLCDYTSGTGTMNSSYFTGYKLIG